MEMAIYLPKQNRRDSRPSYFAKVLPFCNKISGSYIDSGSMNPLRRMTAAKTEEYQRIKAENTGKMCSNTEFTRQGFVVLCYCYWCW